ncbi:MAG: hypothetical protein U0175_01700 [Caldilineaceae bacterium]
MLQQIQKALTQELHLRNRHHLETGPQECIELGRLGLTATKVAAGSRYLQQQASQGSGGQQWLQQEEQQEESI